MSKTKADRQSYAQAHRELEKKHGAALFSRDEPERVRTRFHRLDLALGGGWSLGRFVELFGPEAGYKTTLAICVAADAQAATGRRVVWQDHEHAWDDAYAEALGLDLSPGRFELFQPDTFEEGMSIAQSLVSTGEVCCSVVDSVAALATREELDRGLDETTMAALAKKLGPALRILTPIVDRHRCLFLCINQLREKIGVTFGSNERTPGGRALKHYASARIRMSSIKEGVSASIHKNKLAGVRKKILMKRAPEGQPGFDLREELLDALVDADLVGVDSASYSFGTKHKIRGRAKAVEFVEQHRAKMLEALYKR